MYQNLKKLIYFSLYSRESSSFGAYMMDNNKISAPEKSRMPGSTHQQKRYKGCSRYREKFEVVNFFKQSFKMQFQVQNYFCICTGRGKSYEIFAALFFKVEARVKKGVVLVLKNGRGSTTTECQLKRGHLFILFYRYMSAFCAQSKRKNHVSPCSHN